VTFVTDQSASMPPPFQGRVRYPQPSHSFFCVPPVSDLSFMPFLFEGLLSPPWRAAPLPTLGLTSQIEEITCLCAESFFSSLRRSSEESFLPCREYDCIGERCAGRRPPFFLPLSMMLFFFFDASPAPTIPFPSSFLFESGSTYFLTRFFFSFVCDNNFHHQLCPPFREMLPSQV